jgi:hypothetical protein
MILKEVVPTSQGTHCANNDKNANRLMIPPLFQRKCKYAVDKSQSFYIIR